MQENRAGLLDAVNEGSRIDRGVVIVVHWDDAGVIRELTVDDLAIHGLVFADCEPNAGLANRDHRFFWAALALEEPHQFNNCLARNDDSGDTVCTFWRRHLISSQPVAVRGDEGDVVRVLDDVHVNAVEIVARLFCRDSELDLVENFEQRG